MSEIKMPVSAMLNMAKNELENMVFTIMKTNNINCDLMSCILNDVQLKLKEMELMQLSETINTLNAKLQESEINGNSK